MGIGLGRSIEYVSVDFADKIFDMASDNTQFTTGLGIGAGTVFKYLPAEKRDYIESRIILYGSSGFARGLGHGLGSIYGYLSEEIRSNIVQKYLQTSVLDSVELARYYSIFLNSVANSQELRR